MTPPVAVTVCAACGTQLAAGLLACPGCRRLAHSERLTQLAAEAEAAQAGGRPADALALWRSALDLLPPSTRQHETISARCRQLSTFVDQQPAPAPPKSLPKGFAGVGAGALLLLWKFKALLLLTLTKGKLLLLGLTKGGTVLTMFLSLSLYASAWGWKFGLGLVVSIYVHEMGHVAALRRFGIKATAPMFIPGFGALVRLRQQPVNAIEGSRIGMAGPIWGLIAAVAALGLFHATSEPLFGAVCRSAAWINLFNLLPVWQLDGARGMQALGKPQTWLVAVAAAGVAGLTWEGLPLLIALAAGYHAVARKHPPDELPSDRTTLIQFLALLAAYGGLLHLTAATKAP